MANLRRLIELSDKNNDGKIDFKEFHDMLYAPEHKVDENEFDVISEEDSDSN